MQFQGYLVKKNREEQGYKQQALAMEVGISQSYLSKIESGKLQPRLDEFFKIASILHKPLDSFISLS